MTTREIIAKLNALDVELGLSEADDLDADVSENIQAARGHICEAIDALRNNLTADEA